MITIQLVTEHSTAAEIAAAQALFRQYAEFLRTISACHGFDFERFAEETAKLPTPYTGHGGGLLLAMQRDADGRPAEGTAVGCIGYRASAANLVAADEHAPPRMEGLRPARVCELKRLFVLPEARGQQLGQLLVREALRQAAQRGYGTAILDTEPSSMQAAYRIYTGLGFTEFHPASAGGGGPKVTYLQRSIR